MNTVRTQGFLNISKNEFYIVVIQLFFFVTTKMYAKLASIQINDEIASKVVRIWKNLGAKLVNKL
jgi:hypothetical protein